MEYSKNGRWINPFKKFSMLRVIIVYILEILQMDIFVSCFTVVTLLDCVYHEEMMTYFILDCIMWASNDVKDYPVCSFIIIYLYWDSEVPQKSPESSKLSSDVLFSCMPFSNKNQKLLIKCLSS